MMLSLFKKKKNEACCTAVIVAAGSSSRMNGTDKIMADLGGKPVVYSEEDYRVTEQILADSIVLYDPLFPPNGTDVMDRYIAAFKKLWENMDEVLDMPIDMEDAKLNSL